MKKIILLTLASSLFFLSYAQQSTDSDLVYLDKCELILTHEDPHDTIAPSSKSSSIACRYFRTKIHLLATDEGYNQLVDDYGIADIEATVLANLNNTFNTSGFYFINQGVDLIQSNSLYYPLTVGEFMAYGDLLAACMAINSSEDVIDIYIGDHHNELSGGTSVNLEDLVDNLGIYFGGYEDNLTVYANTNSSVDFGMSNVVSHEMGHVFGLYHTFHRTHRFRSMNSNSNLFYTWAYPSSNSTFLFDPQTISSSDPYGVNCDSYGDKVCDTKVTPPIGRAEVDDAQEWVYPYSNLPYSLIKLYQPHFNSAGVPQSYEESAAFTSFATTEFDPEILATYTAFDPDLTNIIGYTGVATLLDHTNGQALRMHDHVNISQGLQNCLLNQEELFTYTDQELTICTGDELTLEPNQFLETLSYQLLDENGILAEFLVGSSNAIYTTNSYQDMTYTLNTYDACGLVNQEQFIVSLNNCCEVPPSALDYSNLNSSNIGSGIYNQDMEVNLYGGTNQGMPWVSPTETTTYTLVQKDFAFIESTDQVTITVENCIGLEEQSHKAINVYPNPVESQWHIDLMSPQSEPVYLQVYSLMGREVLRKELQGISSSVNTAPIAAGTYLYKIYSSSKLLKQGEFVKK